MEYIYLITNWIIGLVRQNAATMFSALFGTFFGAWFAFAFGKRHESKKEREAEISAGKRAQFAIITQLTALKNMRKQYLDPQRNDPDRALTLTPFSIHAKFPQLDIDALGFMLNDEGAQLLYELMISEHRFITLIGVLEQRNQRHEQMQHKVGSAGQGLGHATVQILRDMTDSLYGLSDDAIKSHEEGFEKLKIYLQKRFADSKGLAVEYTP